MRVGDYVRTRDGFDRLVSIRKDDNHDYNWYRFGNGKTMTNPENGFVIKSSPNIIDLIEVGDYVNGKLVEDIFDKTNYADKSIKLKGSGDYWYNEHIKSIVTKEQFESMEYKI